MKDAKKSSMQTCTNIRWGEWNVHYTHIKITRIEISAACWVLTPCVCMLSIFIRGRENDDGVTSADKIYRLFEPISSSSWRLLFAYTAVSWPWVTPRFSWKIRLWRHIKILTLLFPSKPAVIASFVEMTSMELELRSLDLVYVLLKHNHTFIYVHRRWNIENIFFCKDKATPDNPLIIHKFIFFTYWLANLCLQRKISLKLSQNFILSKEMELLAANFNSASAILGKQHSVTSLENHSRLGSVP